MEGETDVFIPCPFSGQYLPIWKINGKVYELFQITEDEQLQDFIPSLRGLLITRVTQSLDGTTFQCLYPSGVGFNVMESSIGSLTVTPMRMLYINIFACHSEIFL